MLSRSNTTRRGESRASARAIGSQLSVATPARLSVSASSVASNDCKREVSVALCSQILEPSNRKVGSWDSHAASLKSPVARQLAIDRLPQQIGERELGVLAAPVGQVALNQLPKPTPASNSVISIL